MAEPVAFATNRSRDARARNRSRPLKSLPPGKATALPVGAIEPEATNVRLVRWLAVGLTLAVAVSLTPLVWLQQWNMATAPGWARVIVLMATLQAAFIAWMLTAPTGPAFG